MKKTIDSSFFAEYVNIGDLKPNGRGFFSFVRYDTDLSTDKYLSNLFLFDMKAGKVCKQLTFEDEAGIHEWLDDETLILSAIRAEKDKDILAKGIPLTVFYKLNIKSGEYTECFRVHKRVYKFARIDEGRYLLLCDDSLTEDTYLKEADGDWEKYAEIVKREEPYFIADEVPFWNNDGGYANKKRGRLFLFNHGVLKQLSTDNLSVCDMKTFGTEYGVFYGVESGGLQRTEGKVFMINYGQNEVIPVDDSNKYIYTYIQPVDSTHILVGRNDRGLHGEYQNEYLDLLDLKSGKFIRNNRNADIHVYDDVINDITYLTGWLNKITVMDEGYILIATRGGASKLYFLPFGTDDLIAVTENDGKILDYFVDGQRIYMTAMRGLSGPEIYSVDLQTREETRLTRFNSHLEEAYEHANVEACGFINTEGAKIDGWVMKPVGFTEGEVYPTILFIHGGPGSAYGPVFTHEMQVMCSNGYGVIYCNPRGSEGRGGDFADIRTKWGTVDYDDLMEFVDVVIAKYPWIDEKRLGITGGSYGGIITNWIISHTRRFKAAISDRSVVNLLSDFCMSDIGFSCNIDTYDITPWENPGYLWDQSALKYAPYIKTPVLFIHGINDYRCTYDHSLQLHSAIIYFGGISKVFAFKNETHELCRSGSPQNRKRRIDEMIKWFDQYLK